MTKTRCTKQPDYRISTYLRWNPLPDGELVVILNTPGGGYRPAVLENSKVGWVVKWWLGKTCPRLPYSAERNADEYYCKRWEELNGEPYAEDY